MFRQILCWLGYHTFSWKLPEEGIVLDDYDIPIDAHCEYCGISYGS